MSSNIHVIALAGPSCGGKTRSSDEIIKRIEELYPDLKDLINKVGQDQYYFGGNSETNFDVPESVDWKRLTDDLANLKKGYEVDTPMYDFKTHNRTSETRRVKPSKIVLIEGTMIFTCKELVELADLKIFVTARSRLRFDRRLNRDVKERGRNREETIKRYNTQVVPAYKRFVKPSMKQADIVLMNNKHNEFIGLDVLWDMSS